MDNITEVIQSRISQRSYHPEPLSGELLAKIEHILNISPAGPFHSNADFQLIHKSSAAGQKVRLGTYGFISDAQHFIIGKTIPAPGTLVDFGYRMEWVILQMTAMDLGTCWIGGSFKRHEFARLVKLSGNAVIPAVTPVGYPAEKPSLKDRLIRFGAGSKNRKPWSEIFFENDFGQPLSKDAAGNEATALEMVRLAPSASNRQPWRIVKSGAQYHFFLHHKRGCTKISSAVDMQKLDLGIALCHFELTARKLQQPGHWQKTDPALKLSDRTEYILSWRND
ncbi:MAG: nitroreductase family protein [Fidelibacterota bacterium]